MDSRISFTISELQSVANAAERSFGGLTAEQLNWKPAERSWSIAQCFDHLIVTHSLYFQLFDRLASDRYQSSLWERISPFSGFWGRFLIRSMRPENPKKMKTTSKAQPSNSVIGADIIGRYVEHQREMVGHLQRISTGIDPQKTIVTSPLLGIVTYTLDDTLTILGIHSQRHFGQAKRVTDADGFPA